MSTDHSTKQNRQRIYDQAYYQTNRERILARKRAWRAKNRDKIRESNKKNWVKYAARNREYQRQKYQENKARAEQIKCNRGCERCGEKDPCCLEFHHRDPAKKYADIPALYGWGWKRLEAEIAKCIVLCANCHCKEHAHDKGLHNEKQQRGPKNHR